MHNTEFPEALKSLHELPFDYLDGDGIDFEPYRAFMTADEGNEWIRAWTGNDAVSADDFRVFGQDGTGGLAAFWLVRRDEALLEQPVVFFGSEGELGVVAASFGDYLWLLAMGMGPFEAVEYGAGLAKPNDEFRKFALEHAVNHECPPAQILERARRQYPGFEDMIRGMIA